MMLWYKTWCETRVRFALSVAALLGICAAIVLLRAMSYDAAQPVTFVSYIWSAVYKDYLRNLFTILVIVLAGGTLLQERAAGTVGFTLSLPVSRARLMRVRAAVGLAEVVALAAVPAIALPVLARAVGESYPAAQSIQFGVLWAIGGAVVFSASLLCATLIANEYGSWAVAFTALMLYEALFNLSALQRLRGFDVLRFQSGTGMPYFDDGRHVLQGPFPVMTAVVMCAVTWMLVRTAQRIVSRREF